MSRTIDEKVVEMRFDNQDFERNVSQSMSTLDKLKSALDFSNVDKTFSGLSAASDKLDLSGLGNAVEGVGEKFSALETIAVGALLNIGTKISDLALQTAKELTLDQFFTGFDKYAQKSKSVQTIMNATEKEIDEVSAALEKMNWYTDETSYDFTEMVNTIGKFTANGMDLDQAISTVQGISNWGALSGADKAKVNMALYNSAQALGLGYLGAADYKSIQNATMDTQEFRQMAIEEGLKAGTLAKDIDEFGNEYIVAIDKLTKEVIYENEKEGKVLKVSTDNFYSTLTKGRWLDNEVYLNTLDMYGRFSNELNKLYEDINSQKGIYVATSDLIKYIDDYRAGTLDMSEAMEATGKTADELTEAFAKLSSAEYELGEKAFKAGNETRTFQDAIDAVKDAASTQWMNTFETLFGNYEEAKTLWGELTNEMLDIFVVPLEEMNAVLGDWKDEGGREGFIGSIKNIYHAVRSIVDPMADAWKEIFPPMTYTGLLDATEKFKNFTETLVLSEDSMARLRSTFENVFKIIKTVGEFLGGTIKELAGAFTSKAFEGSEGLFRGISIAIEEVSSSFENLSITVARIKSAVEYFREGGDWLGIVAAYKEQYPVLTWLIEAFYNLKDSLAAVGEYVAELFSFNNLFVYYGEAGEGFAGVLNIIAMELFNVFETVADLIQIWTGIDMSGPIETVRKFIFQFERAIEDLQAEGAFDVLKEKFFGIFDAFEERFGSLASWFEPLKEAFKTIGKDFFEGLGKLTNFESVADSMRNGLDILGGWIDKIKDFVSTSDLLGGVVNTVKTTISVFSEFLSNFLSLSDTIDVFRGAGGGLAGIFAVIGSKIRIVIDSVADLIQRLTGLDLHNVGAIAEKVFGVVSKVVLGAISAVKDFLLLFKKDNLQDFDRFGEETEKKFSPIRTFFEGLKKLFEGIWAGLTKLKPIFDAILGKIGEILGTVGTSIKGVFENASIGGALELISKGLGVALKAGIVKLIYSLSSPLKELGGMFDSVKGILDGVKDCFEAWQKDLQAKTLLKIAAAIGIITLAVIALSGIDSAKITSSLGAIAAMLGELIGAMYVEDKALSDADGTTLSKLAGVMIEMSAALLIMAVALKKLSEIDPDTLTNSIIAAAFAIGELVAALNFMPSDDVKGGFAMIEVAASLLVVGSALKKLGDMGWDEIGKGIVAMTAALGELTAATVIIGKFGGASIADGIAMLELAIVLSKASNTLIKLGQMSWGEIARGVVGMTAVLGELATASVIIGKFGGASIGSGLAMIELATSLTIASGVLAKLGGMSWGEIARGIVAMTGVLAEMSAVLILLNKFGSGSVASGFALIEIAVSLGMVAGTLERLGNMSWDEIARGLVAMGGVLAEMSISLIAISALAPNMMTSAAAILVMAGALAILSPVLQDLGQMSLAEIGKSLLELAGVFVVIGVAGVVLGPISPMILALGAAIALLGVGVAGVGAGLLMFSAGLAALSVVGSGAIELLIEAIKAILDLIPYLITKVGEGLMALIKMIGDNATLIAETVVKVLGTILDSAQELIPKLVETVVTIIDEILKSLDQHLPSIVDSVANILLTLLNGIAEYLPKFVQAGVNIVLSLIEGIADGLVENTERAREAFEKLFESIIESILIFLGVDKDKAEKFADIALSMINGLVSGIVEFGVEVLTKIGEFMQDIIDKITEFLPDFVNKGKEILTSIKDGVVGAAGAVADTVGGVIKNVVDGVGTAVDKVVEVGGNVMTGLGNGVKKGANAVAKAATTAGSAVVGAFKSVFGVNSPSKVMYVIGQYLDEGLAEGIIDNTESVKDSVSSMKDAVMSGISGSDLVGMMRNYGFDITDSFGSSIMEASEDASDYGELFASSFSEGTFDNLNSLMGNDFMTEMIKGMGASLPNTTATVKEYGIDIGESGLGGMSEYLNEDWGYELMNSTVTDGMGNALTTVTATAYGYGEDVGEAWNDGYDTVTAEKIKEFENTEIQGPTVTFVADTSQIDDALDKYATYAGQMFDKYGELDAYLLAFDMADKGRQEAMITQAAWEYQNEELANALRLRQSQEAERMAQNAYWQDMAANIDTSGASMTFSEEGAVTREDLDGLKTEMTGLREDVRTMAGTFVNANVYLDSGELVGVMAPKLDQEFGNLQKLGERGI